MYGCVCVSVFGGTRLPLRLPPEIKIAKRTETSFSHFRVLFWNKSHTKGSSGCHGP